MPGRRSARGSRYLPRTHLARQSPRNGNRSFSRFLAWVSCRTPLERVCEWDANRRCGSRCLTAAPRLAPGSGTASARCLPRCPPFSCGKCGFKWGARPRGARCRPVREAPSSRVCGYPHLQGRGNPCRGVTNPGARAPFSARRSGSTTQVVEDASRKPAAKAKGRPAGTTQVTPP